MMSSLVFVVSLFSIQPTFATDTTPEFTKEFCAISQADKCKQTGKGCPGKKICLWKDLKDVATLAATIVTTAAAIDALVD